MPQAVLLCTRAKRPHSGPGLLQVGGGLPLWMGCPFWEDHKDPSLRKLVSGPWAGVGPGDRETRGLKVLPNQ